MKSLFLSTLTYISPSRKNRLILLLIISNLCYSDLIFSQNPEIDSLKQVFTNVDIPDSLRIFAGYKLTIHYSNISIDSQRLYTNQFYELADSLNEKHQVYKLHLKASLAFSEGNAKETIFFLEQALKIEQESISVISMLGLLAASYHDLGLLNKALQIYQKIKYHFEEEANPMNTAIMLYNMGDLKCEMSADEEGLELFQKAIVIADSIDAIYLAGIIYNGIGSVYLEKKNALDTLDAIDALISLNALTAFDKSVQIAKEIDSPSIEATAYSNMALLFNKTQNQEKALNYFEKALKIFDSIGDKSGRADILGDLGYFYFDQNKSNLALLNCKESLQLNEETGYLSGQITNCECLYNAYKLQEKYSEALIYHEKWKVLNDSVFSAEKAKEITKSELTFEFEQEKKLLTLQKEKDKASMMAETRQIRTITAGIGGLALLGFGFFWNARRKNKIIAAQNSAITQQKDDLQSLNTMKDRILEILGHDLRKPVIALRGLSNKINYLIKKGDMDRLQQIATVLNKDSNAIYNTTDNLLHWALSQKNAVSYNPTQLDTQELVEETIRLFRHSIDNKAIDIQLTIPERSIIFADYNSVSTVFRNVLDNAIKYSSQGGSIHFTANFEGEQIVLSIQDSGIGMDATTLKQITSDQKNQSRRGTQGERGTGLGMALIKDLVHSNKGQLSINSQVNKGTIVRLTFPKKCQ